MVAIYRPPGAPPLAYHRDSPYFMFDPNPVATVWIALDDMAPDLGPLTYVKGSHLWGDGRVGSSQNFFEGDGGMALLYSAARRSGLGGGNTDNELKESLEFISMSGLLAGGISIHVSQTKPLIAGLNRKYLYLSDRPLYWESRWKNMAWI